MNPANTYDPAAIGSDVPRSRRQYWMRRFGEGIAGLLGLNGSGALATEIVQAIRPVAEMPTRHGLLRCRAGHGRLVWRARTLLTEEPETIAWLDSLDENDLLWDVGANVGLYSVYAARFRGCRVISFEPEAQNFALLVENIAMNGVGGLCTPACLPLASQPVMGTIDIRYITKGGAYNHFQQAGSANDTPYAPESVETSNQAVPLRQLMLGSTLDELVDRHGLEVPTRIKIDVDGLEPDIIAGGTALLGNPRLRSILIELNRNAPRDMEIPRLLESYGFQVASQRSNWASRENTQREHEIPTINVIFNRG